MNRIAKSAAGGALAIALGAFGVLEGYGPEVRPGVYRSYVDIAGVVTFCNGHTGKDVRLGMEGTKQICDEIARGDLEKSFEVEDRTIQNVETLDPWVRASAALFIANVGEGNFRKSSFLRFLNARRIVEACNAILLYNKARVGGGPLKVVVGLVNRREIERKICLGEPWP